MVPVLTRRALRAYRPVIASMSEAIPEATPMEAQQGMYVTYNGSDGQRHAAAILSLWPDGSATIRRGYYDPMDGTRLTFTAADEVRDYVTGRPVTFGGPSALSPFVRRALAGELPAKVVSR